MARTKKNAEDITTENSVKKNTKTKNMYYQVVKTTKTGAVTMLKGYNKEIK